jgi:hypothetical protein
MVVAASAAYNHGLPFTGNTLPPQRLAEYEDVGKVFPIYGRLDVSSFRGGKTP